MKNMRDFSHFCSDALKEDVASVDWSTVISNSEKDLNNSFAAFFKRLNRVINKHALFKAISKRKSKQFYKPWITKGIRKSIKVKNKLYASGETEKYKYYRNKLNSLIKASKKD